jgi:TRAP-type C4-dicarboxylate transport system substrate-binding protein
MRLTLGFVATAALATAITAPAKAQQNVTLRFSVGANDHPTDGLQLGMKALKQYVEDMSGGTLKIRLFWNTLGGSLQLTEEVKNGTLDMAAVDDSVLGSFHKPMQIFLIPYLFPYSAIAWESSKAPLYAV